MGHSSEYELLSICNGASLYLSSFILLLLPGTSANAKVGNVLFLPLVVPQQMKTLEFQNFAQ